MDDLKRKKILVGTLALLTFPISLPLYAVKTIRRKRRKARAMQEINAVDRQPRVEKPSEAGVDAAPLLSVIMPIYNIEKYLETSIVSVLNQPYRNIELIIVNDASTDNSLAVAKMFEQMDSRVQVIDLPFNTLGGAGIPSNIGLERAQGAYIAFMDGDDLLSPATYETLMQRAVSTGCDLTIGSFKNLFDDTKELANPYDVATFAEVPSDVVLAPADHPKALLISAVPWRKIYKKSLFDTMDVKFPEGDLFYEDNPLHWDAMTAAQTMIFVPVTAVYHRMNRHGQTVGSAAPKLAAHFQHFSTISKCIRKNGGDFAWGSFLRAVDRAHWIISSQTEPVLVEQFLIRFNQIIDEQITPYLSKSHQSHLKRVRYRFETKAKAPDVSAVLYHDDDARAEDLDRTIASLRKLKSHSAEIIVLHRQVAPPDIKPEHGRIITLATRANTSRSYNQSLQLCAGRILTFLHSGDEVDTARLEDALIHAPRDADILRYTPLAAQNTPITSVMLYGRRLVQDNGLFFGPTLNGKFSFDTLCTLYADNIHDLKGNPIKQGAAQRSATTIAEIENEANHLVRQLCAAPADAEQIQQLLESVSTFFNETAKSLDARDMSRLKKVRNQTSDEIVKARHNVPRPPSEPHAQRDFSGV